MLPFRVKPGSKAGRSPFPQKALAPRGTHAERRSRKRLHMAPRIVHDPDQSRSASKEGVVRYVLLVSIVLVVVLFAVAYKMFL